MVVVRRREGKHANLIGPLLMLHGKFVCWLGNDPLWSTILRMHGGHVHCPGDGYSHLSFIMLLSFVGFLNSFPFSNEVFHCVGLRSEAILQHLGMH